MKRFPWDILLALLAGLGIGIAYSWLISPVQVIDSEPLALRSDFKDVYRAAIAASYASNHDLDRARARLALLGDADAVQTLIIQSQRMLNTGETFSSVQQVADLASALEGNSSPQAIAIATNTEISAIATNTFPPPPPELPFAGQTTTPEITDTPLILDTPTPRPTRTPLPTIGASFDLAGQESVCDPNLPDGLLQVFILNSAHRPVPGAEIMITWNGGEDHFFTGLKPEINNGYADFIMTANTVYTVQLGLGSAIAKDITAPACQTSNNDVFTGGIKLTFQQP